MRMKRSTLKQYHLRNRTVTRDREGAPVESFGDPVLIIMQVWPAGGKLQAETYGQRLSYIRNCRVDGRYEVTVDSDGSVWYQYDGYRLREGDEICLDVGADQLPDYQIIAIRPYQPLYMEVERHVH